MKQFRILLCVYTVMSWLACTPVRYLPNYLEKGIDSLPTAVNYKEAVIQSGDILSIQVFSATVEPSINAVFTGEASKEGYKVDADGTIVMPLLGKTVAKGLTRQQLAMALMQKLQPYLNQPLVEVQFTNFRVTFLGELTKPVSAPVEKLTILEAVALAGGLPKEADYKQVRIIRELNGTRTTAVMDLTDANIYNHPYFQLSQNDLILLDYDREQFARKERKRKLDEGLRYVAIVSGTVLTLFAIVNLFN